MESRRLNRSSTSLRRNKSVPSACIRSSHQPGDFRAGSDLDRRLGATKNSCAGFALEHHGAIFDQQPRFFANAHDRRFIFLEKLKNAFLLVLALVRGVWVRIEIVRTALKRNQA